METTTDPRIHLAAALSTAGTVVRAVRPDQLGDATPCPDFDVRTLLGHLVEVVHSVAAIGRGDDPFAGGPDLSSVPDDGWSGAFEPAAHEAQAAWTDDAALVRTVTLPWAEGPGGTILLGYAGEITVHTWDVAVATGQQPDWDHETMVAVLAISQKALPAEGRLESFAAIQERLPEQWRGGPPPYGEAVAVDDDSPLIDQIVAWHGRRP